MKNRINLSKLTSFNEDATKFFYDIIRASIFPVWDIFKVFEYLIVGTMLYSLLNNLLFSQREMQIIKDIP